METTVLCQCHWIVAGYPVRNTCPILYIYTC